MAAMESYANEEGEFTGRSPGQGEREIDALGLGVKYWLPDAGAVKRLRVYEEAEALQELERHRDFLRKIEPSSKPPPRSSWIPLDFFGMLSRLVRHYVLGPEFRVKAKTEATQPEIDRIARETRLYPLIRAASEELPALGDAVFKVGIEDTEGEEGAKTPQATIRYVHPGHYFPELDPLDRTRVRSATLAWVLPKPGASSEGDTKLVVLKEIHTPGRIEYKANEWDGKEDGADVNVEAMFPDLKGGPTGIDEIGIVHVGNNTRAGEHFGRSEFKRIARLVLALENRLAQEDEVLERHARPKLIVGPGVLDPEARGSLADFDVIEIDPSILEKAVKPEYLTWDMQIGAIQHEIEKLEEYLFITTETSPASFGLERDGSQVESARALKFKAHRTVSKINDLRDEVGRAIEDIFRLAQKLELAARKEDSSDGYELSAIRPVFADPVLEDATEERENAVGLKLAGLISRKRAVADLYALTPEEADEEDQAILQDQVNEAAAAMGGAPRGEGQG